MTWLTKFCKEKCPRPFTDDNIGDDWQRVVVGGYRRFLGMKSVLASQPVPIPENIMGNSSFLMSFAQIYEWLIFAGYDTSVQYYCLRNRLLEVSRSCSSMDDPFLPMQLQMGGVRLSSERFRPLPDHWDLSTYRQPNPADEIVGIVTAPTATFWPPAATI